MNCYKKTAEFFFILALGVLMAGNGFAQNSPLIDGEYLFQVNKNSDATEILGRYSEKGRVEVVSKAWNIYKFTAYHKEFDFIKKCKHEQGLVHVQQNHQISLRETLPNDSIFDTQWSLKNTGQNSGLAGADIGTSQAWDITSGGKTKNGDTVIIAVIDNGFELSHPDLDFWKNKDEIPGNSMDDDNNGYVDDYDGWNVYNNNGTITSAKHGTHVSGIIGAKGNNQIGVAGINWNIKVLPVQGSSTSEATAIAAYSYVYEMRKLYNETNGEKGAFIVATNSSFGVDFGKPANFPLWCAIYDSLGSVGILNAAATANSNLDVDAVGDIPTSCISDFMVSVTNTTRLDKKYSNAAYGLESIDLGAPGTEIYSTISGMSYGSETGTSMASPHVAGAIGLLYAAACEELLEDYKDYPDSVSLLMKGFLLAGTDPIDDLNDKTVTGGRLNIYKAIQEMEAYCQTISIRRNSEDDGQLQISKIYPNPSSGSIKVSGSVPHSGNSFIVFTNILGQVILNQSFNPNHPGYFEKAVDVSSLASGIYFIGLIQNDESSGFIKLIKE